MHELAQIDKKSVKLPRTGRLRSVSLGLFTALFNGIIPTSSLAAQREGCLKEPLKETTQLCSSTVWNEAALRMGNPNAPCEPVFNILGENN